MEVITMTKKSNVMKLANDLGYGRVKGSINGKELNLTSVLARVPANQAPKPDTFRNADEKDAYMNDLVNHLYFSVNSKSINTDGKFFLGERAQHSNSNKWLFDVNDYSSKAENDMGLILTLGIIAAEKIKEVYNEDEALDDILEVEVQMTTALPIMEANRNGVVEAYRERFISNQHLVTVHNFPHDITVKVKFKDVFVGYEGELAQFCIANASDDIKSAIMTEWKDAGYSDIYPDVTVDEILGLRTTMGVDIGAGTTDTVIFQDGKMLIKYSTSLKMGYGSVQDAALKQLIQEGNAVGRSRVDLEEFLNTPAGFTTRALHKHVEDIVLDNNELLANEIVDSISDVLGGATRDGIAVEIVYVYGGGSIPMKQRGELREKIADKLKSFQTVKAEVPVLFISDEIAPYLNLAGLQVVLDNM